MVTSPTSVTAGCSAACRSFRPSRGAGLATGSALAGGSPSCRTTVSSSLNARRGSSAGSSFAPRSPCSPWPSGHRPFRSIRSPDREPRVRSAPDAQPGGFDATSDPRSAGDADRDRPPFRHDRRGPGRGDHRRRPGRLRGAAPPPQPDHHARRTVRDGRCIPLLLRQGNPASGDPLPRATAAAARLERALPQVGRRRQGRRPRLRRSRGAPRLRRPPRGRRLRGRHFADSNTGHDTTAARSPARRSPTTTGRRRSTSGIGPCT